MFQKRDHSFVKVSAQTQEKKKRVTTFNKKKKRWRIESKHSICGPECMVWTANGGLKLE